MLCENMTDLKKHKLVDNCVWCKVSGIYRPARRAFRSAQGKDRIEPAGSLQRQIENTADAEEKPEEQAEERTSTITRKFRPRILDIGRIITMLATSVLRELQSWIDASRTLFCWQAQLVLSLESIVVFSPGASTSLKLFVTQWNLLAT